MRSTERWNREHAHLGTLLVRYADDFVVMCLIPRRRASKPGHVVGEILDELGLELHPDKTGMVELTEGKEGFDFLGCHLRKRMSGRWWELGTANAGTTCNAGHPSSRNEECAATREFFGADLSHSLWNWVKDVRVLIRTL